MTKLSDTQRIREALEDNIVEGRFLPGERLDPDYFAELYDCSRTPVREALQALKQSGLVEIRSKRGTFVTELSVSDLVERFEVMAELEGMAARLSARCITQESLDELHQALQECEIQEAAADPDGYYQANARFHGILYDSGGNSYLREQAHQLRRALQPYRRLQLKVPDRIRRSLVEHFQIYGAVSDGHATEAEELAREHVLVQVSEFNQLKRTWEQVRAVG